MFESNYQSRGVDKVKIHKEYCFVWKKNYVTNSILFSLVNAGESTGTFDTPTIDSMSQEILTARYWLFTLELFIIKDALQP